MITKNLLAIFKIKRAQLEKYDIFRIVPQSCNFVKQVPQ